MWFCFGFFFTFFSSYALVSKQSSLSPALPWKLASSSMSTLPRLPPSSKARNALGQYSQRKRRPRHKTIGDFVSSILSKRKNLVNIPHIEKHTNVKQSTTSTFSIQTLESRPTIRKHHGITIRKHFSGTEIKDHVNNRPPSIGIHRIFKIETDLNCRRSDFENEPKDGASQPDTVNWTKKSKEDTDSVSGGVSEPSQHRKYPEPSISSITTFGISSPTPKPEDRPNELGYGLCRRRENPESSFNMRRIMARASEENQRRHYTTSSVGKQII